MFQGLQKRRNFESFMALSVDGKIYFRGNKHDSGPFVVAVLDCSDVRVQFALSPVLEAWVTESGRARPDMIGQRPDV